MKNTLTIARREFATFFNSPIAYIVIVVFLLASSILFFPQLALRGEADMRGFFGLAPLLFSFFAPIMAMRSFAEEKQNGTLEVLFTLPLTDWEVLLGKFLGVSAFGAVLILLTTPFYLYVAAYGPIDKGPALGGYCGLLLMMTSFLAVGLMCSTWTKSQIVAVILGWLLCFALFLSGQLIQIMPRSIAPFIQAISSEYHFQSISRGVVDVRDLIYYASLIGVSLVVAQASLDSRRWR